MANQSNFEDKKKVLFDCLTSAEECIKGTSLEQKQIILDEPRSRHNRSAVGRRFHGKESIFKRPEAPLTKCLKPRHVPDYKINPHKWKRYSLGDTDISDRTNTSAAFAFLAEIEKRKESEQDEADEDDKSTDKIVFKSKRPSFHKSVPLRTKIFDDTAKDDDHKSVLKGSKLLMPEYVIGQKVEHKKRKSMPSTSHSQGSDKKSRNQPQLQHLFEEEDEEEED